ncbi:glycoside hydrolase family 99-like domain-containing protein [Candidatus Hydrogenedentota bacterium]
MRQYDVAAYIWPSYHYEPRMEHFWPEKDGEWYTVRRGTARFPGHDMPRIPLLGCQDEAEPAVMGEHVALAREHGVNVFIMDWYWYENAPCFERQLNDGLIPALKGTDTKFYLMWANHDANSLWDMHTDEQNLLWTGQVERAVLEPMFDRVIERYLKLDCYYRIDNKPVFCIFLYPNLIAGLGGIEQTQDAFEWMRRRCVEKGLPGLHIQAIARKGGGGPEAGAELESDAEYQTPRDLGFDSGTSYQYCSDAGVEGDYVIWAHKAISSWEYFEKAYNVYYPHVSIGWDNTNRNPSIKTAVLGSSPDAFEACLWKAKHYLDAHPDQAPLVTINSWNEWTEGSYLLPDMRWGYRYVQAVRNVFRETMD